MSEEKKPTNPEPLELSLEQEKPTSKTKTKRSHLLWRICKGVLFTLLGIVLFVVLALAAAYGFLQTEKAQEIIRTQVNAALDKGDGLRVELTKFTGSIPWDMKAAVKLSDTKGLWMEIPHCAIRLDFSKLSERVKLALHIEDAHLLRSPELPASPPKEEKSETPLTRQGLREMLSQLTQQTASLPSWVPEIAIENIDIQNLRVDKALYAPATTENLADALLLTLKTSLSLAPLRREGAEASWKDPLLTGKLRLISTPVKEGEAVGSLLGILPDIALSGTELVFDLTGTVSNPQCSLALDLPALASAGWKVNKTNFSCRVPEGTLPSLIAGNDICLPLALHTVLNDAEIALNLPIVAALKDSGVEAGVQDLSLTLPGIHFDGALRAAFPREFLGDEADKAFAQQKDHPKALLPLPEGIVPALNGGFHIRIAHFDFVKRLVPNLGLTGAMNADIRFENAADFGQALSLALETAGIEVHPAEQKPLTVNGLGLKLRGTELYGQPEADLAVKLKTFSGSGLALQNLDLGVKGGLASGIDFRCAVAGDILAKLAGHFVPGEVKLSSLDVRYPKFKAGIQATAPLQVRYSDSDISVRGLSLNLSPAGKLRLEGDFGKAVCKATGKIEGINFAAYKALVPSLPEGLVNANLAVHGTPQNPEGSLDLHLTGLKLPNVKLAPLNIDLKAHLGKDSAGKRILAKIILPQTTLAALGAKSSIIEARIPMKKESPEPDMLGKLQGRVEYRGNLSKLWILAQQADRTLSGDIALNLALAGSLTSPIINGGVQFLNGKFKEVAQGLLIDKINLKAALSQGNIDIMKKSVDFSLDASDGRKGKIAFRGKSSLTGDHLSVSGTIADFSPLYREDVKAVLSGNLSVSGSATAPKVTGRINVDKGFVNIEALSVMGSVDTLPLEQGSRDQILSRITMKKKQDIAQKQARSAQKKPKEAAIGSIDLLFHMANRFIISGFGLESTWRADLNIRGPLNDPGIMGEVLATKGEISILNRKFSLDRGSVRFSGGFEPLLDIKMIQQVEDIEASVNIQGSPRKLDFSLQSTPEMPQEEIISRMLFKKGKSELSQYEMLQLGVAVAKMLAFGSANNGGVLGAVRDTVGIDVLNITQGSEAGTNPNIEMGKYLSEKLYIGVEKTSDQKSGKTSAIIQYELGPRSSITGKTSGTNSSAGFKWKYDY